MNIDDFDTVPNQIRENPKYFSDNLNKHYWKPEVTTKMILIKNFPKVLEADKISVYECEICGHMELSEQQASQHMYNEHKTKQIVRLCGCYTLSYMHETILPKGYITTSFKKWLKTKNTLN